jgi:hypothetical protein
MQIQLGLFAALLSAATLLAGEPAPVDAPYNKVFDPWRACTAAEPLAKRGAPDALRTLFLAAYVRVSQPFLGGEDLETMDKVFGDVLASVGDAKFARALALQRPEVRSAAGAFVSVPLKKFPRTAAILRDAPEIDWPLNKASRDDR